VGLILIYIYDGKIRKIRLKTEFVYL